MSEATQAKREYEQTQAAFEKVKKTLVDTWLATKLGEADARERIHQSLQVLDAVRLALFTAAEGQNIEKYVEEIKQGKKS